MDKKKILKQLIAQLEEQYKRAAEGQAFAQEEANSHVGAMESRYDTFKEEAQYLALAQQKRKHQLESWLKILREFLQQLSKKGNFSNEEVRVGSIVEILYESGLRLNFFIAPAGGGEKILFEGKEISIITPTAPLASALIGAEEGDFVEIPGKQTEVEIISIS